MTEQTSEPQQRPTARQADQEEASPRSDYQRRIRALEGRDLQLWSINALVMLVLAAGFVAIIFPNVIWNMKTLRLDGRYVPQLLFGFITLIVLFNIYAVQQRQTLHHLREEMVQQIIRSEAAEKLSLVDPLTEIFNRRYLSQVIANEVNRADRHGTNLTLLMIDVDGFKSVNTRFGHLEGDRILREVASLLKKTFRTSDTVIRYGGDEFLVILAETNEAQAQRAVQRLYQQVDRWNQQNAGGGYKMGVSCGVASYSKGLDVNAVLDAADQRMYVNKSAQPAAG